MIDPMHRETSNSSNQPYEDDHYLLEMLFRTMPEPVFYRDRDLRLKRCTDSFCAFLDRSREQILGRTIAELGSGNFATALREIDSGLCGESGSGGSRQFRLDMNGFERTYLVETNIVQDGAHGFSGIVGMIHDISPKIESQRRNDRLMRLKDAILAINSEILEVHEMDRFFVIILEKVLDAIDHADVGCVFLLDDDGMLRIAAVSGYSKDESRDFRIKVEDTFQWKKSKSEVSETLIINDLQDFMKANDMPDTILKDMEGHTIRSTMSAPLVIDGRFYGLINLDSTQNNVFDDTDRSLMECVRSQVPLAINMFKSYERTSYESEHDKLTGLFNRRYFENIFVMIQSKASRYDERFSLVMFDLNNLKKINDSLGHLAGDAMILHFADAVKGWFRSSDIFARFGGDEFIAIIFHVDGEQCIERLETWRDSLMGKPLTFKDARLNCSFSYGVATFKQDATEYDDLIAIADECMYADKVAVKARLPD